MPDIDLSDHENLDLSQKLSAAFDALSFRVPMAARVVALEFAIHVRDAARREAARVCVEFGESFPTLSDGTMTTQDANKQDAAYECEHRILAMVKP